MPLATEDIRRLNLGAVLGRVIDVGRISRAGIADATGLSRATVTALVAELLAAGLVRETTTVAAAGKGRPRTLLEAAGDRIAVVTALLDADHATVAASALDGTTLARVERRHGRPLGDPGAVADVLALCIEDVLERMDAAGRRVADLSVVVWAPVSVDPPLVIADTDLEWDTVDLLALLRDRSGRLRSFESAGGVARLDADTLVAAVAEHADQGGPADLVYLKSDSGIGGAIISGGAAVIGHRHLAAALGHLPIVPGGIPCTCGQRGCLVTVAGPDALLSAAGLTDLAATAGLTAALDEFVGRIRAGEPAAVTAWRAGAAELARALQILALGVDPEVIVLGGYLAELADDIAAAFAAMQPSSTDRFPAARVVGSRLGQDAALLGARRSALARILADPLGA